MHGVDENVVYSPGFEVERTPYDMDTLFVVGCRSLEEVIAQAEETHVDPSSGANPKFCSKEDWEELVYGLLDKKYMVTFDYDVIYHDWVLENGFNERQNFISQISIKLPYINQLNYNACIKIDDTDFKFSNPGVWVHQIHDLLERKKFTSWSEYEEDNPVDNKGKR